MQNANTDATLVCHANKPFDDCLWSTPYGVTYSFPNPRTTHEDGRIMFFGFTDTDCGVIIHNVGPDDNGGWMCQLHSKAGDFFQNATDIVPLFTGKSQETVKYVFKENQYRVTHLLANLGWIDLDLGCSTTLLGQ